MIMSFHSSPRKRNAKRIHIYVKKQVRKVRTAWIAHIVLALTDDENEAKRLISELWPMTDEQIGRVAEYILMRQSPLRNMMLDCDISPG